MDVIEMLDGLFTIEGAIFAVIALPLIQFVTSYYAWVAKDSVDSARRFLARYFRTQELTHWSRDHGMAFALPEDSQFTVSVKAATEIVELLGVGRLEEKPAEVGKITFLLLDLLKEQAMTEKCRKQDG